MLHDMLCMPVDDVGKLHLVHILRCPRGVIWIMVKHQTKNWNRVTKLNYTFYMELNLEPKTIELSTYYIY